MPRTKEGKPILNKPFKSKKEGKKYSVYVKADNSKGYKLIHFGAKGSPDWRSGTASKEQRNSFRARMSGIRRKDGSRAIDDKSSPAYWAYNYLW
jgi:hypothetical protein